MGVLRMISYWTRSRSPWLGDTSAALHPHWNDAVIGINTLLENKPLKKIIISQVQTTGNWKQMYLWDSCSEKSFYGYLLYSKPLTQCSFDKPNNREPHPHTSGSPILEVHRQEPKRSSVPALRWSTFTSEQCSTRTHRTLGKALVSECTMAAFSNTVQPADKSKVWSLRETQQIKAPAPEQTLSIEALESHSVLLEVDSRTCCGSAALHTNPAVLCLGYPCMMKLFRARCLKHR